MSLNVVVSDPPERALAREIRSKLDDLTPARGPLHGLRQHLLRAICDELASNPNDVIETIASVTPRTGHLVVRFRVLDSFNRALARAAEHFTVDGVGHLVGSFGRKEA